MAASGLDGDANRPRLPGVDSARPARAAGTTARPSDAPSSSGPASIQCVGGAGAKHMFDRMCMAASCEETSGLEVVPVGSASPSGLLRRAHSTGASFRVFAQAGAVVWMAQ